MIKYVSLNTFVLIQQINPSWLTCKQEQLASVRLECGYSQGAGESQSLPQGSSHCKVLWRGEILHAVTAKSRWGILHLQTPHWGPNAICLIKSKKDAFHLKGRQGKNE